MKTITIKKKKNYCENKQMCFVDRLQSLTYDIIYVKFKKMYPS